MRDREGGAVRARCARRVGFGLATAIAGILVYAGVLFAQELPVETRTAPVPRESRDAVAPLPSTRAVPPAAGIYRHDVGVRHEPGFIEPFAGRYRTSTGAGRFGLSGWTAPNVPIGGPEHGTREVAGWFSLGFSVTWDDSR